MRRLDILLLFVAMVLSSTVLFQNCGGDLKGSGSADTLATQNNNNDSRTVPEFLPNRSIPLDNKNSVGESSWSVGGEDKFYYETDYRATYESTIVTVFGRGSDAIFNVVADDCEGEKTLSSAETSIMSGFYESYIPNTAEKTPDPVNPQVQGCAFPRLILDSVQVIAGVPAVDFEIFFAPAECVPDNDLYVVNIGAAAGVDPAAAKAEVEAWFNGQIDQVCGTQ